jgi:hypothetical protein
MSPSRISIAMLHRKVHHLVIVLPSVIAEGVAADAPAVAEAVVVEARAAAVVEAMEDTVGADTKPLAADQSQIYTDQNKGREIFAAF